MSNSYTPIHNDVLDALMKENLSGAELRIVLAVWRKTYGFTAQGERKKFDYISASQLMAMTLLPRRTLYNVLKALQEKKILCRSGMKTGFCKDFMKLNVPNSASAKNGTLPKMAQGVPNSALGVPKMAHTKETNTKEKETKENVITNVITQKKTKKIAFSDTTHNRRVNPPPESHSNLVTSKQTLAPSAKNSMSPCTKDELWKIASDLKILPEAVTRKHEEILEMLESGEFQAKYMRSRADRESRTMYFTLRNWLRMAISSGRIQVLDPEWQVVLFPSVEEQRLTQEAKEKMIRLGL